MKHAAIAASTLIFCLTAVLPDKVMAAAWTKFNAAAYDVDTKDANHIRHLMAAKDAVYALGSGHRLLRFPFDGSPASEQMLPGRVVDISIGADGRLWLLTFEELSDRVYVLTPDLEDPHAKIEDGGRNLFPSWKASPPLQLLRHADAKSDSEDVYTIAAGDKLTFVLTNQRLAALDQESGEWKTKTLDHPFNMYELENPVSLVQDDRWVWYGTDAGEWGGHLVMADFRTGETAEPSNDDPVTAIVPDPGKQHCVLFTQGLAHLGMTEGGLYRTCGDKPETVFSDKRPLWDLIPTQSGLYALSQGSLIPIKDGKPDFDTKLVFPRKIQQSVAGLPAVMVSDMLVLYTGARWEVSTSGLTPYAIPLASGAKVQLQPYPLVNDYPSQCANSEPTPSDEDLSVVGWQQEPAKSREGASGVELTFKGWDASWEAGIYAIDAACHIVPISPMGRTQSVSADKSTTLFVPYATVGLHPGHWNLYVAVLASGKQTTLEFSMDAP